MELSVNELRAELDSVLESLELREYQDGDWYEQHLLAQKQDLEERLKARTKWKTLHEKHHELMNHIMVIDNQIDAGGWPDEQEGLVNEIQNLCDELSTLEEVMSLKSAVDCNCFYQSS